VIGELAEWTSHSPEQVQAMRDGLALLEAEGKAHIEE
jgi:rifampin ADP-ribosylating transferase